jgi:7-cyano-7-deazaguanine synthase
VRIVVLASGGVDSSVIMLLLRKSGDEVLPLFVDYGQLAMEKEWKSCKLVSSYLGLNPHKVDVSGFGKSIQSGITNNKLDIEKKAFLPTRNLLFLTIGAAYAYANSAAAVCIGILANPIFPDQTVNFIQTAQKCINTALDSDIRIITPLISLDKRDILKLAYEHKLPMDLVTYCHSDSDKPCGICISCKERIAAEKWLENNKTWANSYNQN